MKVSKLLIISLLLFALVFALVFSSSGFASQEYPSKLIEVIIPFSAGGGTDINVRAINRELTEILGVPIVVRNMPGADAMLGIGALSIAKPDGYTIAAFNLKAAIMAQIVQKPDFDLREFTPIGSYAKESQVLAAKGDFPYDYGEMFDLSQSGEIKLSIGNTGGITIIITNTLKEQGLMWDNSIEYPSGSELVAALVRGEIDLIITPTATASTGIADGFLKGLAVLTDERHPGFPDIPSHTEFGYPSIETLGSELRCLFAPPGLPAEKQEILESALQEALQKDRLIEWSEKSGNLFVFKSTEEIREQTNAAFKFTEQFDLEEIFGE